MTRPGRMWMNMHGGEDEVSPELRHLQDSSPEALLVVADDERELPLEVDEQGIILVRVQAMGLEVLARGGVDGTALNSHPATILLDGMGDPALSVDELVQERLRSK